MSPEQPQAPCDLFISWSGNSRGKGIANALREFFDLLSFNPFVSTSDVLAGEKWYAKIYSTLQSAKFGVVALTKANRYEPWLQFEAGAISIFGKPCCPVLFDDIPHTSVNIPSPLRAQQIVRFDKESMWGLVRHIAKVVQSEVRATLRTHFEQYWPNLEAAVAKLRGEEDPPEVMSTSECVVLPPTLKFLYDCWARHKSDPAHADFKLHSFSGIRDDPEYPPVHQARATHDHEEVYYLWADAEHGSTISARLCREPTPRHVVRFHNNEDVTHPANVAFRPSGRQLLVTPGGRGTFRQLAFRVRIPKLAGADPARQADDAEEVVLGIRVVDRYRTHWKLCKKNSHHYAWQPVRCPGAEDWQTIRIDLAMPSPHQWQVFEGDGNPLYHTPSPAFSAVTAVVIEFARAVNGTPVPGGGVVEVADFAIDTQPPTPIGGR